MSSLNALPPPPPLISEKNKGFVLLDSLIVMHLSRYLTFFSSFHKRHVKRVFLLIIYLSVQNSQVFWLLFPGSIDVHFFSSKNL